MSIDTNESKMRQATLELITSLTHEEDDIYIIKERIETIAKQCISEVYPDMYPDSEFD